MDALDEDTGRKFESIEQTLIKLIEISKKELENEELAEEDKLFIYEFGETLNAAGDGNVDSKKTSLVADVHTEPNHTLMVLEEGTGYVDMVIVAIRFLTAGFYSLQAL